MCCEVSGSGHSPRFDRISSPLVNALESDSRALLDALGMREASASAPSPQEVQQDDIGTAFLHDNAPGEGCTLDVESDDLMDVDFSSTVSQLNSDMLLGRCVRGSSVSIYDLHSASLPSELYSRGID